MKALSCRIVGESYRNGTRYSGFGQVVTDAGRTIYVPESECRGFYGILEYAERLGVDVSECRARIAAWAQTGQGVSFSVASGAAVRSNREPSVQTLA